MAAFNRKIILPLPIDSFFIRLAVGILSIILFVVTLVGLSLYQSKGQYEKQAMVSTQNLSQVLDENIYQVINKTDHALLAIADEINRQIAGGGILANGLIHMAEWATRQQYTILKKHPPIHRVARVDIL